MTDPKIVTVNPSKNQQAVVKQLRLKGFTVVFKSKARADAPIVFMEVKTSEGNVIAEVRGDRHVTVYVSEYISQINEAYDAITEIDGVSAGLRATFYPVSQLADY